MRPDWQTADGSVRLWNCDSRAVLPIHADAVVTDPPYGVEYSSGWDNQFKDVRIAGDDDTTVRDHILALYTSRPCIVFGSWKAPRPAGVKAILIWDKGTVGMGDLSIPWFPATEEIYVIGSGWIGTRTSPVLRHWVRNEFHPTEKPVALMQELIAKCPGDLILDPFMGSATTGVAALRLGRKFAGCESDPGHFATAVARIEAELNRAPLFEPAPQIQSTLFGAEAQS